MAAQELWNASGQLLGKIQERSFDGKLELIDAKGQMRGIYNPQTNETIDNRGQLVGKGNLLTMLL
jgi:hypothetical protein